MEMMDDVRSGDVNLIIVKDLSRFGRNYLETGHYLENELPSLGCRFVSLSENIDTEGGENDILPLLNAMNDYYLKSMSDKIKAAMTAMAKDGQYVSGKDPYGYMRIPDGSNKLTIDPEAAAVVREMFELRASGAGYWKISQLFNNKSYMPPLLYHYTRINREPPKKLLNVWKISTIQEMLTNELYIGNMVQFKQKRVSYRSKKEIGRDPSEWIRVDNTHEPIVRHDVWNAVQEIKRQKSESIKKEREYSRYKLFVGRLFCEGCQRLMTAYSTNYTRKKSGGEVITTNYLCINYRESGGTFCTSHSITEEALKAVVYAQIKSHIKAVRLNEAKILQSLQKRLVGTLAPNKALSAREAKEMRRTIAGIDAQTEKLYENRLDGVISEDSFTATIANLEAKRQDAQSRLAMLERSEEDTRSKLEDINRWIRLIKEKSSVTEVDEDLIESLIDKIVVGEKATVNGSQEQDIQVYFKYVGLL